MPVRTKRLVALAVPSTGSEHTLYTAGDGETTIIKDVRLYSELSVTRAVLFLQSSGGARVTIVEGPMSADGRLVLACWIVLHPGDMIRAYCTGNVFRAWVSGTELEGVAD